MIYTIDMLLSELGQLLPLGNGERYRQPVNRYVKYVLGKVGHKKTADVYTEPFELQAGRVDPLPEHILDVLDAGFTKDKMSGEKFNNGYCSDNPLAFMLTPFGIMFANLENETVFLNYHSLPLGPDGKVAIVEEVYQACLDYCYAKLITGFPAHPRFSMQLTLENAALGKIDEARSSLNKKARLAQNRVNRKYL
ncbi:hypothetical protein [Spirosoma fluviale]|uniref:Uncharacterized protein n=1 Tax=Spirosoma fluviale TaxID=1597977 RepID=A0A286FDK9_9BACT|nr:hypothetical protein [Spirosoma fluviale]SOD80914.1 hypothetical protein SAMN06269250_1609 [Spirosoma fluviale]